MNVQARLAVDFGTSHTFAVVERQDEPPRALLFDGSPILPSAVCLGDDGVLHVGRDAQRTALVAPTRYEPHPKRRIDDGKVLLGDTEVPVVDLLAGVLRRVAAEARQAGLSDPAAAGCTVLTCPAGWGAARRNLLTQAAEQAGLGAVRLVDEPVAAATYCLRVEKEHIGDGQPLVVFDFGGGTLDVALIHREPDSWRLLATGGLDDLGGIDVDAALVGHLGQLLEVRDPAAWRRLDDPTTAAELRDRGTFWSEVRAAKEMLSRVTTAPVQVPRTDDTLHLTREELEHISGPLIDRAVDETRRVLERAGVDPAVLAGIFLVGGSSRLPLVATHLHTRLGIAPRVPEQPELPVAYGALLTTAVTAPSAAPEPPSQTDAWPTPAATGAFTAAPAPPPAPPRTPVPEVAVTPEPEPEPEPEPDAVVSVPLPREPSSDGDTRRPLILAVATIAVLVLVVSIGISLLNDPGTEAGDNPPGRSPGRTSAAPSSTAPKTTGKLTTVNKMAVSPDASAVAVAAMPTTGYYAVSAANKTQVTGQPTAGSEPWTVDLGMYPEELELTVVEDLLIVDGEKSVRHNGEDVRAVIDTKTRRKLWERVWSDRWDVAYYGTDAVVEWATGFEETGLTRIDLRTSAAKWTRPGPKVGPIDSDRHRGQVALSWPTPTNPASTIAKPGDRSERLVNREFRPYLHAGDTILETCGCGDVAVLDANTGKQRLYRKGLARFEIATWTVYEGMLVAISDHNDQDMLVAFRISDLSEVWRRTAAPKVEFRSIEPCGPKQVCLVQQGTTVKLLAIDPTTGKDAWPLILEEVSSGAVFVPMPDGLLVGENSSGFLYHPHLVNYDGTTKRSYDDSYRDAQMIARQGKRTVLLSLEHNGDRDVFVSTIDNPTKRSPAVRTTDDEGTPETTAVAGDTIVFTTKDDDEAKQVYVLKASDLPAP